MNANTIEALSKLAWPVLAAAVLVIIWPTLRQIIKTRGFTIKFADMEVTVQNASDQLLKSVTDLQDKVAVLMGQDDLNATTSPSAAGRTPRPVAPERAEGPKLRTVLWVDDHPENNGIESSRLRADGINVVTAKSTSEAIEVLKRNAGIDAVITDMGRREGLLPTTDAGIRLIEAMRREDFTQPVLVYTSQQALPEATQKGQQAGALLVTSSPVELLAAVRRTSVRP